MLMSGDAAFSVNQKIVYPSQGVGEIVEIKEKVFKGEPVLYYVIYIAVTDMTIMAPVGKAEELGICAIVSADEANAALAIMSEEFEQITSDWKLRYQTNLELLKKGSVADIAAIVRSLYHRSKIKELPILERKLYDSARKLLEEEVSCALGISKEAAESLIHSRLEPLGDAAPPPKKSLKSADPDDDFLDDPDLLDDGDEGDDDIDGDEGDD